MSNIIISKSNKILLTLSTLFIVFSIKTVTMQAQTSYPVPPDNKKMLFYLQRSLNKNTIVYELNTLGDGKLNADEPVKIHWIRYEDKNQLQDLSYIQQKAFGIKCKALNHTDKSFLLEFNNFNRRKIILSKSKSGSYKAFMNINNEKTELESVFIKTEKNALGMSLTYKHIDVSGISTLTGKKNTERIFL